MLDQLNIFSKLIDFLFPPSEETIRVRNLTFDSMQSFLTLDVQNTIQTLCPYMHPDIRALIHEAKFHGNARAHALLNSLFETYLTRYKISGDMIIPIPLSRARMRARGYNQVTAILSAHTLQPDIPVIQDLLIRVRDTRPQTDLKRAKRLKNLDGAFGVKDGMRLTGKHILLVDDVCTTGTTLEMAKAALLPYEPSSITMIALAH